MIRGIFRCTHLHATDAACQRAPVETVKELHESYLYESARRYCHGAVVRRLRGVSQTDYLSAKRKFQTIDKQPPKPGTRITLTSPEINAYVQTELPKVAPAGIREPRIELLSGNTATGRALIDFLNSVPDRGSQPIG